LDEADFFITHEEIKTNYMTAKGKNATKGNGEKCDNRKNIIPNTKFQISTKLQLIKQRQ
jgi:hypothetical protein